MALDSGLAVLVAPFADMVSSPIFFAEVVVGGFMAGVMYAMVALGFVLIFKASGVFNFAQGVMVLFAALTLVGLMEHGLPVWLALVITTVVMIVLAFAIERVVLRPLVNQPPFTLLMATIGLTFFLEGLRGTRLGQQCQEARPRDPRSPCGRRWHAAQSV